MTFKRIYAAFLCFMLIIAAIGVLAIIDGARKYHDRPLLHTHSDAQLKEG